MSNPRTKQLQHFLGTSQHVFISQMEISVVWKKSLVLDPETATGGPLPVGTMNFAVHKGRLFAGMAADFEQRGYSAHSASVYLKSRATSKWTLDASFGPGTERVGKMLSVRLSHGFDGKPIPGGPIETLVLGVIKMRQAGHHLFSLV